MPYVSPYIEEALAGYSTVYDLAFSNLRCYIFHMYSIHVKPIIRLPIRKILRLLTIGADETAEVFIVAFI